MEPNGFAGTCHNKRKGNDRMQTTIQTHNDNVRLVSTDGQRDELGIALGKAMKSGKLQELPFGIAQYLIRNQHRLPELVFNAFLSVHEEMAEHLYVDVSTFPIAFHFDNSNRGWKLDRKGNPISCNIVSSRLTIVSPFQPGEGLLLGGELMKRSIELGASTSQLYAEALYLDRAHIPRPWKHYVLAFTDTIWFDRRGARQIACLTFTDEWKFIFRCCGGGFGNNVRLVKNVPRVFVSF